MKKVIPSATQEGVRCDFLAPVKMAENPVWYTRIYTITNTLPTCQLLNLLYGSLPLMLSRQKFLSTANIVINWLFPMLFFYIDTIFGIWLFAPLILYRYVFTSA